METTSSSEDKEVEELIKSINELLNGVMKEMFSLTLKDIPERYRMISPLARTQNVLIVEMGDREKKSIDVAKIGKSGHQLENERMCLMKMDEIDKKSKLEPIPRLKLKDHFQMKTIIVLIEEPVGYQTFQKINKFGSDELKVWVDKMTNHLKMLHSRYDFIHSDIKPSNIILSCQGDDAILIDYGFSVFTNDENQCLGGFTPAYSSKNQRNFGKVCFRDDMESLCYTFYAMEIGVDKYEEKYAGGPPELSFIYRESEIVRYIVQKMTEHWCIADNLSLMCDLGL